MDQAEILLIEKYMHQDGELRRHVHEHRKLEAALEEFNRRRHLTTEEQADRNRLKKRKLREKEAIIRILEQYRQ